MEKVITNPVKAIRAKCLDCCCFQANEVALCTAVHCPLHPFRMGKNPYRQKTTRTMTDEQKAAVKARFAAHYSRGKSENNSDHSDV